MLGDRYYNDTRHVENGDIPTLLINANPLRQNIWRMGLCDNEDCTTLHSQQTLAETQNPRYIPSREIPFLWLTVWCWQFIDGFGRVAVQGPTSTVKGQSPP